MSEPAQPNGADARSSLRERLEEMKEALIEGLAAAEHLDGGRLSLLATVGEALRALER